MLAVTVAGESFPLKKHPVGGFDVICNPEVFDARAYMYNMVFDNFKTTYPGL